MTSIVNLDLLTVGVAVAGNLILGFVIFIRDRKNATYILFFSQTVILSIWSVMNYLTYTVTDLNAALLVERLVMFFAVPNSIVFMLLMHTFPNSRINIKKKVLLALIGISVVVMGIALSPYLFTGVEVVPGVVTPQPIVGLGMAAFIPVAILSIFVGIYFLVQRYLKSFGIERLQLRFLIIGVIAMFILIFIFNFIFPAFLDNTRFIPFSAFFTLPFVVFTAYAIFKYHLLNVKVISTEIVALVLTIASFLEIILTTDPLLIVFRSGIFLFALSFSIVLIRSVRQEVEQRERLQKMTEDLEAANVKLEELSHFKTQLLSLASHQVKSPLAAIKGYASILLEGLYGPVSDKVRPILEKMKASTNGLINLVDMLLDLRRVEEGKMEYQFAKTDMKKLVGDTVEELRELANEKRLSLDLVLPHGDIFVNADAQKLKQVIQNLLDNAIKYTEPRSTSSGQAGFVKVELRDDVSAHAAMVTVSDSGLGIPHDLMPYLFEEFVRDERVKKEIRGTGFGLYIARKIVEAHGGKIFAESKGPNQGSTFHVALPRVG